MIHGEHPLSTIQHLAVKLWAHPGDDGIVNNAALLICDQAVSAGPISHASDVSNHDRLEKVDRILALQAVGGDK